MITNSERTKLIQERTDQEKEKNEKVTLWLSFCDPELKKGSQFLGVIITRSLGLAHSIEETHSRGINPGGEVRAYEIEDSVINEKHFNILLSKESLKNAGYI